jgi:hypothetical protein
MTYAKEYLERRERERAEAMAIRLTGRATCAHCGGVVGARAESGFSKQAVILQEHYKPGNPHVYCIASGTLLVFDDE